MSGNNWMNTDWQLTGVDVLYVERCTIPIQEMKWGHVSSITSPPSDVVYVERCTIQEMKWGHVSSITPPLSDVVYVEKCTIQEIKSRYAFISTPSIRVKLLNYDLWTMSYQLFMITILQTVLMQWETLTVPQTRVHTRLPPSENECFEDSL